MSRQLDLFHHELPEAEIAERAAAIRANWPEETHRERAGIVAPPGKCR